MVTAEDFIIDSKTWFDETPDASGWRWSILFENGDVSNSADRYQTQQDAESALKLQLEEGDNA